MTQPSLCSSNAHSEIDYDALLDSYRPVINHIDNNASYDGFMFETYGAELAHVIEVHAKAPNTVWTLLDGDDGLDITSGLSYVNRMGFFICEVPVEDGKYITVVDDDN